MSLEQTSRAKVPGVLKYNDETREEILMRNYWGDKQYTQFAAGIGKYYEIKDRTAKSLTDGLSLFDFTHKKGGEYADDINHQYQPSIPEIDTYEIKPIEYDIHKWDGSYPEIFNVNNKLEKIAADKFLEQSTIGNYANADRFVYDKYLTPSLISFYGSNPQREGDNQNFNVFNMVGGVYKHETGRIADIPEAEAIHIVHSYSGLDENNGGKYYLDQVIENGIKEGLKYDFSKDKYYVAIATEIGDNKTGRGDIVDGTGYIGFNPVNPFYDEGDTVLTNKDKHTIENSLENEDGAFDYDKNNRYKRTLTQLESEEEWLTHVDTELSPNVVDGNLMSKTNALFKEHKIGTMISRFHDDVKDNDVSSKEVDSAIDETFGHSHGRNLLKLRAKTRSADGEFRAAGVGNGYDNPYCRVWTYHHQYNDVQNLIRPFSKNGSSATIEDIQEMNRGFRSGGGANYSDGGKYLAENTVLGRNGFVNITPIFNDKEKKAEVKKCMFSIENLAWKDVPNNQGYLSAEQRGPNGGRIMWFPPYDLNFSESINTHWESNSFIGRGENVYTYTNTERTGTLSFALLIDHPAVVNNLRNKQPKGDDGLDKDILRFFAGCEMLDLKDTEDAKDKVIPDKNNDTPQQAPSEEKTENIKFYLYYPNNYSGNMLPFVKNTVQGKGNYSENAKQNKKEWQKRGHSDQDFYEYILLGSGTTYFYDDKSQWCGYEMIREGGGISKNGTPMGTAISVNPHDTSVCTQWTDVLSIDKNIGPFEYRCDFDLRQKFQYKMDTGANYKDTKSFGLNCKLNKEVSTGATHSFAEVMLAMLIAGTPSGEENFKSIREYAVLNGARDKEITRLTGLFRDGKAGTAFVAGAATKQDSRPRPGCETTNDIMLANRRRETLKTLIRTWLGDKIKNVENNGEDGVIEIPPAKDPTTVVSLETKAQRFAVAEISLNKPEITTVAESNSQDVALVENSGKTSTVGVGTSNGDSGNTKQNIRENIGHYKDGKYRNDFSDNFDTDDTDGDKLIRNDVMVYANDTNAQLAGDRYEDEAGYFSKLQDTDPLIFKSITQKFKYFSPAYHSISPEGFNARLTFLHQCTRQGHTIEATDKNGYAQTAGNLSFGRMPVCVLRLGDFINTRIIIESVSINYGANGPMQWDLNPEGAGVQPMYAKVELGIKILGGQSLAGPVSRLQNAVSFDYYANAGVYDNRADRIKLEEKSVDGMNGTEDYKDMNKYTRTDETFTHLWSPKPIYKSTK